MSRRYRARHARRSALSRLPAALPAAAAPALLLPIAHSGLPADAGPAPQGHLAPITSAAPALDNMQLARQALSAYQARHAGPAPQGHLAPITSAAPALDNVQLARQALSAYQARHARAEARKAHYAATHYTVHRGDSLSGIARKRIGNEHRWMALYGYNRKVIGHDPNVITPGDVLRLPPAHYNYTYVPPPPPPPPPPAPAAPAADTDQQSPAQQQAAPAPAPQPQAAPAQNVQAGAPGSFQACVIARESGGNARAVNPTSGAGGLYQFLPSTWAALGHSGLPQNASVAEQNQAFQQAYAQSGTSPWAPYDGC
jgi:resuscitation-promoting factor RpfC